MSIESVMLSSHLTLCRPLLLLPSILPSIRVFSNELALCIRWPKNWTFSFSNSPSNEYSELIVFRIDWFDLLAVQGTLKSLLQHQKYIWGCYSWPHRRSMGYLRRSLWRWNALRYEVMCAEALASGAGVGKPCEGCLSSASSLRALSPASSGFPVPGRQRLLRIWSVSHLLWLFWRRWHSKLHQALAFLSNWRAEVTHPTLFILVSFAQKKGKSPARTTHYKMLAMRIARENTKNTSWGLVWFILQGQGWKIGMWGRSWVIQYSSPPRSLPQFIPVAPEVVRMGGEGR